MKSISIKGKSTNEIKVAFEEAVSDDFKPTLGIIFLSISQDRTDITSFLDSNGVAVFGATTIGEFTDQGIDQGSIAILLMDINPAYFSIVLKDHTDGSAIESGRHVGQFGKSRFSKPAFIIVGSNINTPGELIMEGLLEVIDNETKVIGGMAGDTKRLSGNCVFTNQAFSLQGVLALIIDEDNVSLAGEAVSGWKAIGTEKTITSCDGSWIHTIDNKPAIEVVKKFTGLEINDNDTDEGFLHIGITFPLQIIQKNGKPVMRPLLLYDPRNQSLMVGGKVENGSKFRFSMPPDFEVVDEVIESSKAIQTNELPDAEALIIFSCIGRKISLGPMISEEIEGITNTWNTAMTGFFCMGEFGKTKNGNTQFHGTTCSWVALKEKR